MNARWLSIPFIALLSINGAAQNAEEPEAAPATPEAFARQRGCFECHRVEKKVVGPAFQQVAARYKNESRARDWLIEKVSKGGKGNWADITGGVPMPPHSPRLTETEITRLVDWILNLSNTDPQTKQ